MESKKEAIIDILYYVLVAEMVYLGMKYVLPVLTPFLLALIIVLLIRAPARAISGRLHCSERLSSIGLLFLTYFIFFVLVALCSTKLFSSVGSVLTGLPTLYTDKIVPAMETFFAWIRDIASGIDPDLVSALDSGFQEMSASLGQTISDISSAVFSSVSGFITGMPSLIVNAILMVVSSFYLASDYAKVSETVWLHIPKKWQPKLVDVQKKLKNSIRIYAKSYTLIFFMTWLELLIGLWLLQIPYAFPISAAIALCDIMPVLGTGTVLIPWAIVAAILGYYPMAAGIGVLYLVITIVRNIVEPRLVGKQIGLHPLLTLISMIVGAHLFGLLGLFGLPVGLSIYVQLKKDQVVP